MGILLVITIMLQNLPFSEWDQFTNSKQYDHK